MGASSAAVAGALLEPQILACMDYVSTYVGTTKSKSASLRCGISTAYNCQIASR